jgi:hypothetical protein
MVSEWKREEMHIRKGGRDKVEVDIFREVGLTLFFSENTP